MEQVIQEKKTGTTKPFFVGQSNFTPSIQKSIVFQQQQQQKQQQQQQPSTIKKTKYQIGSTREEVAKGI
jgi:hypothetical protein